MRFLRTQCIRQQGHITRLKYISSVCEPEIISGAVLSSNRKLPTHTRERFALLEKLAQPDSGWRNNKPSLVVRA